MSKGQYQPKGKDNSRFIDRTGEIHYTKEGYKVEIIECLNRKFCTIRFENGHTIKNLEYSRIKKGSIKNPFHKRICNIGYIGVGKYFTKVDGRHTTYYNIWHNMICRCYDAKTQERQKSYIGTEVCEDWHNFQNFAKWYEENLKPHMNNTWELDKDILCPDCKLYSPETCILIPKRINTLVISSKSYRGDYPIGVRKIKTGFQARMVKDGFRISLGVYKTQEEAFYAYKVARESYIKETLNEFKKVLDHRVYEKLYNLKISITD